MCHQLEMCVLFAISDVAEPDKMEICQKEMGYGKVIQ